MIDGKNKFDDFRFEGLSYRSQSNKYLTMKRVSDNEEKIVVKVGDSHLISTKYGYALILDYSHVVFLKPWQVDRNWFGNEVLIDKKYWIVKEWGEHKNFEVIPENYDFNTWLNVAKEQEAAINDEGLKANPALWLK